MQKDIETVVSDGNALRQGYLMREGFVFALGDKPAVFDTLVVRFPSDACVSHPLLSVSEKTLDEHIRLINRYHLEKVIVICNDLSFIRECPSIRDISVFPADDSGENFDYSPIYQLPNLRKVNFRTVYGQNEQYKCTVDYSKIPGLTEICAANEGHIGYETVQSLEALWISNSKQHKNLEKISSSSNLQSVTCIQCNIQTLRGIGNYQKLEKLALFHNRSLLDISALNNVAVSLKMLCIENCPKIKDFSVLDSLINLEHLHLYGNNLLRNLEFLKNMPKLKTFCFTMNVEDGDLSHCMSIPYVSCKNRKHFNLKDSQLPKK